MRKFPTPMSLPTPATEGSVPTYSITLVPGGPGYRTALEASRRLAKLAGQPDCTRPHITVQMIYGPANLMSVRHALSEVTSVTPPFVASVVGVGVLNSLTEPDRQYIHARLARTPEMLLIFRMITQRLQALGLCICPYSEATWVPHLSLISGHFPRRLQVALVAEARRELRSCTFSISVLQLNRLSASGRWYTLMTEPLAAPPMANILAG